MDTTRIRLGKNYQSPKRKLLVALESAKKSNNGFHAPIMLKSMDDAVDFNTTPGFGSISRVGLQQETLATPGIIRMGDRLDWTDKASPLSGNSFSTLAYSVKRQTSSGSNQSSSSFESSTSASSNPSSSYESISPRHGADAEKSSNYADRLQFFSTSKRRSIMDASYDDANNASPLDSADSSFCDDNTSAANTAIEAATPAVGVTASSCYIDGSGVMSRLSDLHVSHKSRTDVASAAPLSGSSPISGMRPRTPTRSTPQAFREQVSANSAKYQKGESPYRLLSEPITAIQQDMLTSAFGNLTPHDDSFVSSYSIGDRSIGESALHINKQTGQELSSTAGIESNDCANDGSWMGPSRLFDGCKPHLTRTATASSSDELCCSDYDTDSNGDNWIEEIEQRHDSIASSSYKPSREASGLFSSPLAKRSKERHKGRILFGASLHESHSIPSSPPDFGTPVLPHADSVDSPVVFDSEYPLDIYEDEPHDTNIGTTLEGSGEKGRSLIQLSPVKRKPRNSCLEDVMTIRHQLYPDDGDDGDDGDDVGADFIHSSDDQSADDCKMHSSPRKGPSRHHQHDAADPYDTLLDHVSVSMAPAVLETSGCSSLSDVSSTMGVNQSSIDSPITVPIRGNAAVDHLSNLQKSSTSALLGNSLASSSSETSSLNISDEPIGVNITILSAGSSTCSASAATGHRHKKPSLSRDNSIATSSSAASVLPMPDQSAFDSAVNLSRVSASGSSPMCPQTPIRTPSWMHEKDDAVKCCMDEAAVDDAAACQLGLSPGGAPMLIKRSDSLNESKILLMQDEDDVELMENISFANDFNVQQLLGSGSFGEVFQVRDKNRGNQFFAVKRSNRPFRSRKDRDWLLSEVRTMKALGKIHCKYLIQLVVAWQENGHVYFEIEYADRGSLADFVLAMHQRGQPIADDTIAYIVHNVASGLAHIHGHGYIHMDIKPANLLISSPGIIKIGDFGMTIPIGIGEDGQEGDTRYMAPELLCSLERRPAADIFSLGITIYELCMQRLENHSSASLVPPVHELASSSLGAPCHLLSSSTANGVACKYQKPTSLWTVPSDGPLWHMLRTGAAESLHLQCQDLQQVVTWAMMPNPMQRPSAMSILSCPAIALAGKSINVTIFEYTPSMIPPPVHLGRSNSFEENMDVPESSKIGSKFNTLPRHPKSIALPSLSLSISVGDGAVNPTLIGDVDDRVMTPISGVSFNFRPLSGPITVTSPISQQRSHATNVSTSSHIQATDDMNSMQVDNFSTPQDNIR